MYYGITIVVSFHPLFITKVDQAFHVKCFFEEASRGLTAELGVSTAITSFFAIEERTDRVILGKFSSEGVFDR
ncbi:hypothetical protein COOONC_09691 [Cooperia oncophora]